MFQLLLVSTFVALAFAQDGTVALKDRPYQVAVEEKSNHLCSGSLIKDNMVLTSAHCTSGKTPTSLTIRAGSIDYQTGGETSTVASVCQHPQYNAAENDFDVSVLLLNRAFPLTSTIKLIDLQAVKVEPASGSKADVTGWRLLKDIKAILTKVEVKKVEKEGCGDLYPNQKVTDRMTCYNKAGTECNTDYGAPLRDQGSLKQVGIMSWGTKGVCGNEKFPAVYTNIADKNINDHIQQCINGYSSF